MSAAYVSNLVINAGASFTQTFILQNSDDGSLLDLYGFSVEAQLKKWFGSSYAVDFTVTVDDPPINGRIILSLTPEQTKIIKPGRYVYDIVTTDPYSVKNRVVEGSVLVSGGVTG